MRPIIVIGHSALDSVYRVAAFPTGPVKVRALEHIESGGGMAANAAAAIARLGGTVELWSRTGADEAGARMRAYLAADGVDVRYVKTFDGARSSTSAVLVDARGERMIVGERDHAMSMDTSWLPLEHIAAAGAVLSDLRWLEATTAAFARAKAAGVATVIDADLDSAELLRQVLPLTDYAIFPSPALEALLPEPQDTQGRLREILALGPRHAGVTRGSRGYLWQNRAGRSGAVPAFKVDVVDTTGAGDAFHGAFAWALVQGFDDALSARVGAATAALKCRKLGARAGLPTRAELDAFLAKAEEHGTS
jgi:sulfofructose kinase